jgi:hypothetical protein
MEVRDAFNYSMDDNGDGDVNGYFIYGATTGALKDWGTEF